jgi:hypothetical protein
VGCLANANVAGWSDATCTGCDGLWGHELDAGCSGPGGLVTAAAPALSCAMVAAAAFAFAFTIAMFSASAVSCTVELGNVSAEPEPLAADIAVAKMPLPTAMLIAAASAVVCLQRAQCIPPIATHAQLWRCAAGAKCLHVCNCLDLLRSGRKRAGCKLVRVDGWEKAWASAETN